jgi:hypothetical protein
VKAPEFERIPSSVKAASAVVASISGVPSAGAMTGTIASPYSFANSKSRWSWAGTLITAPVP